jgi:hypothetical protein
MSADPIARQTEKTARGRAIFTAALDSTNAALQRRIRNHRMLIVVAGALIVGVSVWCVAAASLAPAGFLLGLFSLVALAIWNDARIVNHWRRVILFEWVNGRLDLQDLIRAVMARKTLPPRTISTMFASLSEVSGLVPVPTALEVRRALSLTLVSAHGLEAERALASATKWAITAVSISVALLMQSWWPLAGAGAILMVALAKRCNERYFAYHWLESMLRELRDDAQMRDFASCALTMNWSLIDGGRMQVYLNSLKANWSGAQLPCVGPPT